MARGTIRARLDCASPASVAAGHEPIGADQATHCFAQTDLFGRLSRSYCNQFFTSARGALHHETH
jgi:hypothetical protein